MIFSPSEIRPAREKLGLSQHDLAQRSGIPATSISRIERGRSASSVTLERLTLALQGVPG